uniref:Major facilitator superfamily (MFS) profile domain-containing protein n=1 Tax=Biomphalaria glabrata TaxID=6526 RepID=A0A2C9KS37_BIOGL
MNSASLETDPLLSNSISIQPENKESKRKRVRATICLSVIVVIFFLSYIVTVIIYNPYLYDIIARDFPNFNGTSQTPCLANMSAVSFNTTGKKIQEEIFRRVATIELYLNLTNYLVAIIPILILGPLTDRYGRKVSFLFALSGTMIKQVVYLVVIYKDISPYWLLLGHLCDGLGGSFGGMLTSIFSVISDISDPGKKRSMHIAFTEAIQTISASGGQMLIAQWIKVSYTQPLWYGLALAGLCLFLIIFCLPETSEKVRFIVPAQLNGTSCCSSVYQAICSCFQMVRKSVTIYMRDDTGRKRLSKRRLVIAIFTLTVAVNFSLPGVQALYLMKFPLCWSATKVNMFYGGSLVSNWVAILCLLAILQRVFNMPDRGVAIIGVISSGVACAFLSLATNDAMVYEVAVLNMCTRVIVPMLRSVVTGLVDHTEQGAVYAGMGCIETIAASVFSLAANRIFYATLSVWAGLIFAVFSGIMFCALVLLIILNVLMSRATSLRRTCRTVNRELINPDLDSDPSW